MDLNDDLYIRFRDLLLRRAGLHYPERRRNDLAHGLGQAAATCGLTSLEALYQGMVENGTIWDLVIIQLTIGETYFFRNAAQFTALRERVLPDLMLRRGPVRSLRLWSAGCATGEEAYSLAMTLADVLPAAPEWQVSILATDINTHFLQRAREALYGNWSFRETSEAARERFFTPEGPRWRLKPEWRRQVIFARLNLAEAVYPVVTNGTVALDLILCRNVTIYFDEATTRQVIDRFYAALAPGGWLIVGHAEPNADIYRAFETHNVPGSVLYRKPVNAPAFVTVQPNMPAVALPPPTLPPSTLPPPHFAPPLLVPTNLQPATAPRPFNTTTVAALVSTPAPAPPAPLADLLAPGRAAADRGDWRTARASVEAALSVNPLCAAGYYLLGQILEHLGELDGALNAYRRSVYLEPTWVMGNIGMANVWRQTGHLAEARRGLRSALYHLTRMAPNAPVAGADEATAAELSAYVRTQLELLNK
ncbi:MAG: tetratricopeptide repeat protein [Candidatus Viridilinea halotolerans]|uniref:Tetratricopeptide repeat protein n=1 Tax=Candidatus Viridilinea halotolerans TaxID=2491704 RepID=A0A426U3H8_9CHLR|nr:MAG: tetratricopeptide repeat protein [Candidatus Viridilinea halotolerans]